MKVWGEENKKESWEEDRVISEPVEEPQEEEPQEKEEKYDSIDELQEKIILKEKADWTYRNSRRKGRKTLSYSRTSDGGFNFNIVKTMIMAGVPLCVTIWIGSRIINQVSIASEQSNTTSSITGITEIAELLPSVSPVILIVCILPVFFVIWKTLWGMGKYR